MAPNIANIRITIDEDSGIPIWLQLRAMNLAYEGAKDGRGVLLPPVAWPTAST